MDRPQLRGLAEKLLAEAAAVMKSHEQGGAGIEDIALTDPINSLQWFGGDAGAEKFYHELCHLFQASRDVQARDFRAFSDLKFRKGKIERLVMLL